MRPVLRGLCLYTDLTRDELDLNDIANMNEAMDVEEENRMRIIEAHQGE